MSVAELTISYITIPEFEVSLQKRKAIFGVLLCSFVGLISLYLYLSGEIVTLSFKENTLKERLNYALILSSEKESELVKSIYNKNSDFFAKAGFQKPLSIEIIKRNLNVAEVQISRPLY